MSDRHDVRTTCPRDCYDACGALVRVAEGRIVHVRGDPDHPVSRGKLCRKCTLAYNGVFLDPAARLTSPLLRRGPKNTGSFVAVSWDEALGVVADRLGTIIGEEDARTITYSHYTGSFSLLSYFFPMRLMRRLGATEVAPDTICNDAGHTALTYVYGTSLEGFDPRTAADARCILVWGANPSASAPHQHADWLPSAPGAVVVVDPVRTPTAEQADLHLQPFPGSDAALAFGLIHILARDGLVAEDFLTRCAIGWEELLELAAPCDPAWTQSRTGVLAANLERAAHLYGSGPSLLWIGQGLQRQPTGGNVVRSVAALPALTGNLGRAGAGFLYLNGFGNRGVDEDYLSGADAVPDVPEAISHMNLAAHLEDPARSRAFVCWNVNPAASCPEQGRLRRALEREDLFTVVVDLFPTDTVDLADVVLPAASWLEFDDLVVPYFHRAFSAQVKGRRRGDHRACARGIGYRARLRGPRRARNGLDARRSPGGAVCRPAFPDAEWACRARLGVGRGRRPRASAAPDRRRAAHAGAPATALAGVALVAQLELLQRRAGRAALGRADSQSGGFRRQRAAALRGGTGPSEQRGREHRRPRPHH